METPAPGLVPLPPELSGAITSVIAIGESTWRVFWTDGHASTLTRDTSGAFWISVAPAGGARPLRVGPVALSSAGFALGTARAATSASEDPSVVVAPIAGVVRRLLVARGDAVHRGQVVAVVEAMKMELSLAAAEDGVVASVDVEQGAAVARGARLVTLALRSS